MLVNLQVGISNTYYVREENTLLYEIKTFKEDLYYVWKVQDDSPE